MIFRVQHARRHDNRRPYVLHNALSFRIIQHHLHSNGTAAFVIYSEHKQVTVVEFVTNLVVRNVRLCRRTVAYELQSALLIAVRHIRRIRYRR